MAKLEDIIQYLNRNAIPHEVINHVPAFSAHEVAVVSHALDKDLAKTLIVQADEKFMMVVLPADHRIDEHKLRLILKAKHVHLVHEEDLTSIFPDCEIGAMPPFGNLYALPVYIDKSLTTESEIVFNACSHSKSIRMRTDDYLKLVQPAIDNFSKSRFEIEEP